MIKLPGNYSTECTKGVIRSTELREKWNRDNSEKERGKGINFYHKKMAKKLEKGWPSY